MFRICVDRLAKISQIDIPKRNEIKMSLGNHVFLFCQLGFLMGNTYLDIFIGESYFKWNITMLTTDITHKTATTLLTNCFRLQSTDSPKILGNDQNIFFVCYFCCCKNICSR